MKTQKIRQVTYIFDYEDYDILKQKMEEIGIKTFRQLAKKINISSPYLCRVINGETPVTIKFFKKLEKANIKMI